MPTQEEINAARVELDIANDNYANLANKYNNYMTAFESYANATPEVRAKLEWTMQKALADFNDLKLSMYAAEDRIAQAQNRVNALAEVQPVVPQAWNRRRQVVVPETVIEPAPIQEVVVPAWGFWWDGWVNNNGTLVSPDWATKVYPDWSISFWEVTTARPQNYYDTYSQMKATWAVWPEYTQYFKQFWIPTSHTSWLVRNDLINNKWLTPQQANDFVWDWSQATMAPNAQYSLTSPQRVRSNPWSYRNRQIQTWGTVNPNDPRLLTNR